MYQSLTCSTLIISVIALTLGYISDDDHEKIVSVIGLNCVSAEIQRIKKVLFSTCNKNTIDKIEYGLREAFTFLVLFEMKVN